PAPAEDTPVSQAVRPLTPTAESQAKKIKALRQKYRRDATAFLQTYRKRLSHAFARWDLGPLFITQAGEADRRVETRLDDIYYPLRVAAGFDAQQSGRGEPLTPLAVLNRQQHLALRGAVGSGKTTWIRWTFRRLLALD